MNTEKEITLIHEELQNMNKKIDRIYNVLIGDEEMKIEGLVDKVSQHDRYIQRQKLLFAKYSGIATAMGILGGIIVQIVMKLFL
jgi:hypothetical protein